MTKQNIWEKFVLGCSMSAIFIFLAGTKACQEDYDVGSQSTVPTATATEDDGGIVTRTPTGSVSPTETPEPTETDSGEEDTPTPTATDTPEAEAVSQAEGFLTELAQLDENDKDEGDAKAQLSNKAVAAKSGNWLGKAFQGDSESTKVLDSDADGFADWYEEQYESDAKDSRIMPPARNLISSKLKPRLSESDEDLDGSANNEELSNGTDPAVADSDGDGYLDGLENLAGTDPKNSRSYPADKDRDGVADSLESERGMNTRSGDSDRDGINDAQEFIIGSNPLDPDSDSDGILDGKEYELGSDPTVAESK